MIPTIALVVYTGYGLHEAALKLAGEEATRTVEAVAAQQSLLIKMAEQMLRTMAESNEARTGNMTELSRYMAALILKNTLYSTINAFDVSGKLIAAGISVADYSVADRDYFKFAVENSGVIVGSIIDSRSTGLPIIPVALPVYSNNNTLRFVLVVGLRISAINDAFANFRLPSGTLLELVDRNGKLIVRMPQDSKHPIGRDGSRLVFDRNVGFVRPVVIEKEIRLDTNFEPAFRVTMTTRTDLINHFGYPSTVQLALIAALSVMASIILAHYLYSLSIGKRIDALISLAENIGGLNDGAITHDGKNKNELAILERILNESKRAISAHELERQIAADEVSASLREKNALIKEIHHRVKNNFQIISSLLSLQAMNVEDDRILHMFEESRNRIQSMALIHEQLYQTEIFSRIDFGEYARALVDQVALTYHEIAPGIVVKVVSGTAPLPIETAVPLGLILNELLSNCYKHAFPEQRSGCIAILLGSAGEHDAKLIITDNGVGMPSNPSNRRPGSLGLDLVDMLVSQLKGTLRIEAAFPGLAAAGALFEITIPLPLDSHWTNSGSTPILERPDT
ncbi:MAG: sensor histidine kinase [Treponemataceae bacterium]